MSLEETMTGLMNAARMVSGVNSKLTIGDLTKLLVSPTCRSIVKEDGTFSGNCGEIIDDTGSSLKFVSNQQMSIPVIGIYYYYGKDQFTMGKNYSFNALMRGDFPQLKVGDEADPSKQASLSLDKEKWKAVSITFTATRDFFMYGSAKRNNWFELKNYYFTEIGGVINRVLSTIKRVLTPQLGGVSYVA